MKGAGISSNTGVLLLAFAGPRSLDEVEWFLGRLTGKNPLPAQVEGLKGRYRSIGGASPLPAITARQAQALEASLQEKGYPLPVYVGMRYGHPLIAEALEEIRRRVIERLILVSLSPYRSSFTSEGYYNEVRTAIATWDGGMELVQIDDWHTRPSLCAAWADQIERTLEGISLRKEALPIIFTAHSLPQDEAMKSPYVRQVEETIAGIVEITGPLHWKLAFQSRGRGEEWLGPDPKTVLKDLVKKGNHEAVIVPIGFIVDHLETLYDLDISLKDWAKSQGIEIIRIPCLNDAPGLIEALAYLVEEVLEEP